MRYEGMTPKQQQTVCRGAAAGGAPGGERESGGRASGARGRGAGGSARMRHVLYRWSLGRPRVLRT